MTYNETSNQHEEVDTKPIHKTRPTEARLETGVIDISPHFKPLSPDTHAECHTNIHNIENHSQSYSSTQSHSIESHSKLHTFESTQSDHLRMPQTETTFEVNETDRNERIKELDGEKIKQFRLELLLRMREIEQRIQALEHKDQEKEQVVTELEHRDQEKEQVVTELEHKDPEIETKKMNSMEQKLKEMEAKVTACEDSIALVVQRIEELKREISPQNIKIAFLSCTIIILLLYMLIF